jgi:hypothetical protein
VTAASVAPPHRGVAATARLWARHDPRDTEPRPTPTATPGHASVERGSRCAAARRGSAEMASRRSPTGLRAGRLTETAPVRAVEVYDAANLWEAPPTCPRRAPRRRRNGAMSIRWRFRDQASAGATSIATIRRRWWSPVASLPAARCAAVAELGGGLYASGGAAAGLRLAPSPTIRTWTHWRRCEPRNHLRPWRLPCAVRGGWPQRQRWRRQHRRADRYDPAATPGRVRPNADRAQRAPPPSSPDASW